MEEEITQVYSPAELNQLTEPTRVMSIEELNAQLAQAFGCVPADVLDVYEIDVTYED